MSEYIIDIDLLKKAVNSVYRCALDQEKVDIDLEHAGEVVRCKDCIHRMKRSDNEVVCELRAPLLHRKPRWLLRQRRQIP